jgi:alanine transaminase
MNKSLLGLSKSISRLSNESTAVQQIASFHVTSCNQRTLNINNMNQAVVNMQYAVRGPVVLRAGQIENEIEKGTKKPFGKVIRANIGDCHATGQKPITFLRQFMALVTYPALFTHPDFPSDVKEKAKRFLSDCKGGSVGKLTKKKQQNFNTQTYQTS